MEISKKDRGILRELGKQMVQRGGGKIVNMGSFWGQLGVRKQLPYCAAKAAIEALNGQMLEGRRLKVEMANPQASRSGGFRSGGFGGGKARTGGR